MKRSFSKLVKSWNTNLTSTTAFVLRYYNVRYTKASLHSFIERHIEYPSLLSVQDALKEYGIESVAIHKGKYSYADFELPFICAMQKEDWPNPNFTVVTKASLTEMTYLNPLSNELEVIPVNIFEQLDKHIVLLLDGAASKDEVNYTINKQKERYTKLVKQIPIILFVLVLTFFVTRLFSLPTFFNWIIPFFFLSSVAGIGISSLLILYEIDSNNPFVKEVCGGRRTKVNCHGILTSAGGTFLGVSWSIWGFTYFGAFFSSLVLFTGSTTFTLLWSLISILSVPYIVFSLFYQWRIIKQWCPLCLGVQIILFLNAVVSIILLSNIFFEFPDDLNAIYILFVLGISFFLLTYHAVLLIKQAHNGKIYERMWKKLRFHPDIFRIILERGTRIHTPPDNLGVVLGNPNAENEIIKVCNPYCKPCSEAHSVLYDIIKHNRDIKVRIIFTATGNEKDYKTPPVMHILAIQETYGIEVLEKVLDDWYMAEFKDYEAFSRKYPINGELKGQKSKVILMKKWCDEFKIRATPTLFINGYEYPNDCQLTELKNLF